MLWIFWIVGFFPLLCYGCPSNCDHGSCVGDDDRCECDLYWSGDRCQNFWFGSADVYGFLVFYVVVAIALQAVIVIFAMYQLYVTIRSAKTGKWSKWNFVTLILIISVIAGIIRIVYFSIDPHRIHNEINLFGDWIIFNVPLVLWCIGAEMLFMYWIEIYYANGIKPVLFITKMKPFLIASIIACIVIILPLSIWAGYAQTRLSRAVFDGSLATVFLFLIILSSTGGMKLIRYLNYLHQGLPPTSLQTFLQRLNYYILVIALFLGSTIVTLILYSVFRYKLYFLVIIDILPSFAGPWPFLWLNLVLRLCEFGCVFSSLIIVSKRSPNRQQEDTVVQSSSAVSLEKMDSL